MSKDTNRYHSVVEHVKSRDKSCVVPDDVLTIIDATAGPNEESESDPKESSEPAKRTGPEKAYAPFHLECIGMVVLCCGDLALK